MFKITADRLLPSLIAIAGLSLSIASPAIGEEASAFIYTETQHPKNVGFHSVQPNLQRHRRDRLDISIASSYLIGAQHPDGGPVLEKNFDDRIAGFAG